MMRRAGPIFVLIPAAALLAALADGGVARAQSPFKTLPLPPRPQASTAGAVAGAQAVTRILPLPPNPPTNPPGSPAAAAGEPRHLAGPSIDPLAIPLSAPPPPVLPPPIVVPVRPQRPPPPATVVADAPGAASDIPRGIRITFGHGRAELNPTTYGALQAVLAASRPGSDFTVRAYAAGRRSDPSYARRLSLSRALAVRSVLIHGGIASARIALLALGAATKGAAAPADRVDITETEPK